MTYLGLDPGKSGGIAAITPYGHVAHKTPETDKDIFELLRDLSCDGPCFAILEYVSASPQMGVTSSFHFGEGYGKLQMALCVAGIPYERVTPVKWQNALRCRTGGDKNISKAKAQELFPTMTITHAVADALLLAEYCKRLKTGEIARDTPPKVNKQKKIKGQEELPLCPPPISTPTPKPATEPFPKEDLTDLPI